MTTGELIRLLEEWPEDTEVRIFIIGRGYPNGWSAPVLGTRPSAKPGLCFISNEGLR